MGDEWFDSASLEHFWIRRRFEVLKVLASDMIGGGMSLAEIGCGSGLLQRQIEDEFGLAVDGFDLNLRALSRNVSQKSALFCYDICERRAELTGKNDAVFLFDVIEHVEDDAGFLSCAAAHVKPGGILLVNVPAQKNCYSAYDAAVGHARRYDRRSLAECARRSGLLIERETCWGLPLLPLLWWRKLTLRGGRAAADIIRQGMTPSGALANQLLLLLSRLEPCPQMIAGTSLMAVLRKPDAPSV